MLAECGLLFLLHPSVYPLLASLIHTEVVTPSEPASLRGWAIGTIVTMSDRLAWEPSHCSVWSDTEARQRERAKQTDLRPLEPTRMFYWFGDRDSCSPGYIKPAMLLEMTLYSWFYCLYLQSAGVKDVHCHPGFFGLIFSILSFSFHSIFSMAVCVCVCVCVCVYVWYVYVCVCVWCVYVCMMCVCVWCVCVWRVCVFV